MTINDHKLNNFSFKHKNQPDRPNMTVSQFKAALDSQGEELQSKHNELIDEIQAEFDRRGINVQKYGAKGDGIADDYPAIQSALDYGYVNKIDVYVPPGTYYLSQPVRTRNEKNSYTSATGIRFIGAGKSTILTRKHATNSVATYGTLSTLVTEAAIAIHNSNDIFENFSIENSKIGIYIGQDPRDTPIAIDDSSHTHFNRFDKIWMTNIGTGILFKTGYGAYYNSFNRIHIIQGQIGVHFAPAYNSSYTNSTPNRNALTDVRISKVWIGCLAENGDTNTLDRCNWEQISNGNSGLRGPQPTQLHDTNCTAIYVNKDATTYGIEKWNIINNVAESCTRDLYYEGYGWNFVSNYFDWQNKVVIDSRIGIKLGTIVGSYGSDAASGLHVGGLHVNMFGQVLYPTEYSGVFIDSVGVNHHSIRDKGYDRTAFSLTMACPQILSATNDSISNFWSLGSVREWWVKAQFTLQSNAILTDPLTINLPVAAHTDFKSYSNRPPMKFDAIVQMNQIVIANFDYTVDAVKIPAPTGGWRSDQYNYLDFQVRYY